MKTGVYDVHKKTLCGKSPDIGIISGNSIIHVHLYSNAFLTCIKDMRTDLSVLNCVEMKRRVATLFSLGSVTVI